MTAEVVNAVINGSRVRLDPNDPAQLLGRGGEATVFRHGHEAIKIFHPVDRSLPAAEQRLKKAALRLKEQKLKTFPVGLPDGVLAPSGLVHDGRGVVIGYRMPLLSGMTPIYKLADQDERDQLGATQGLVTALFLDLHRILAGLHGHSTPVIVGDLNDGNEMFRLAPKPVIALIDVDSMQFGGFPCVVGAQRFLDPKLYNHDLAQGLFSTDTDWYAYNCLLFQSLLCALPYGGTHKRLRTFLRRAEARVSVLNSEVQYPAFSVLPDTLPDDLLHHFVQVFEHDLRGAFPLSFLETLRWTTCSCGNQHARAVCPKCAVPGQIVEAIRYNRQCKATRVFECQGRIRLLKVEGGVIKVIYEEAGKLYRESRKPVWTSAMPPHSRLSIMGRNTWIGANGNALCIRDEELKEKAQTDTMGNLPVFDSTASILYTVKDGYLRRNGSPVGTVLKGRTWLRTGEEFGLCFAQAGLTWFVQVFDHVRPKLIDVQVPPPVGKLRDAEAVFSDTHVLLSITEERNGNLVNVLHLIAKDGALVASVEGDPDKVRMLASIRGKALLGDKILTSTNDGLLLLAPNGGRIEESKLFTDSQPFVEAGTPVFATPKGSVWVADPQNVWLLELK